jgi:hypothetical protein
MQLWARAPLTNRQAAWLALQLANRSAKAATMQAKHAAGAACPGRQATAGLSARQLTAGTTGGLRLGCTPNEWLHKLPYIAPQKGLVRTPLTVTACLPVFSWTSRARSWFRPFCRMPSTKHYRFFYKGSFINLRQQLLRSLPV